MVYTKNQIERLVQKYETLLEYVDDYIRETYPNERQGDTRIQYGRIEEYVNTACHCHPERSWVDRGSLEDFSTWIKAKGNRYTTTHYTI